MKNTYACDCLAEAILKIVHSEELLLDKHEMLTAIGLASTNDFVFKICEEIRNELPDCPTQIQIERDVLLRDSNKIQFVTDCDPGVSEHVESNGVE
jgi:hypothetical protein